MKKIIIPIHSFIDVVTNSSTSIYVGCHSNTIEYAKELIDTFLKIGGSDKTADDLFTFEVVVDFDREVTKISYRLEDYYTEEEIKNANGSKLAKDILDKIKSGKIEEPEDFGKDFDGCADTRNLIITSKNDDKLTIDLGEKIQKIFDIEEGEQF